MRRFTLLLLGVVCCLLFSAGGQDAEPQKLNTCVASIDCASTEQLLCEQACNSDLNLPRAVGALTCPQATSLLLRNFSDLQRAALRPSTEAYAASGPLVHATYPKNRSAASRAVDYYVYQLRRLII